MIMKKKLMVRNKICDLKTQLLKSWGTIFGFSRFRVYLSMSSLHSSGTSVISFKCHRIMTQRLNEQGSHKRVCRAPEISHRVGRTPTCCLVSFIFLSKVDKKFRQTANAMEINNIIKYIIFINGFSLIDNHNFRGFTLVIRHDGIERAHF